MINKTALESDDGNGNEALACHGEHEAVLLMVENVESIKESTMLFIPLYFIYLFLIIHSSRQCKDVYIVYASEYVS